MNNQHSRREEEQNEPSTLDGRDLNGDIVQAGDSGEFRNEANNGQGMWQWSKPILLLWITDVWRKSFIDYY